MCGEFSALAKTKRDSSHRGFIPFSYIEALDEYLKYALIVHVFGFGETTIHPQFIDILKFLFQYEVYIDFFTNGTRLDDKLCRFLVENKIGKITVSTSFTNKEHYENMYIGASFEKVIRSLKTLSIYKKEFGSEFPVVEINSLAFTEHVNSLPGFVKLMASCGVNVIHLKSLTGYNDIPEIHNHIAVYRKSIEGKIIAEAKKIAIQNGITLATNTFETACHVSDEGDEDAVKRLVTNRIKVNRFPKENNENDNKAVPISDLKQIANTIIKQDMCLSETPLKILHPIPPGSIRDDASLFNHYKISKRMDAKESEYCMEPFKTVYVTTKGLIYPCCFGHNFKCMPFGTVGQKDDAVAWDTNPFRIVRNNILDNNYPFQYCGACLKVKSFPRNHFLPLKANLYGKWYEAKHQAPFEDILVASMRSMDTNSDIIKNFHPPETLKTIFDLENQMSLAKGICRNQSTGDCYFYKWPKILLLLKNIFSFENEHLWGRFKKSITINLQEPSGSSSVTLQTDLITDQNDVFEVLFTTCSAKGAHETKKKTILLQHGLNSLVFHLHQADLSKPIQIIPCLYAARINIRKLVIEKWSE